MRILIVCTALLLSVSEGYSQSKDSLRAEKKEKENEIAPWFVQRFQLSAGAFYVVNSTNVRVSGNGLDGTDINMEKDLGVNREVTTFLANFQWQISRRSRITLNYYSVNRNGNKVLDKDIVFQDGVYPANSTVSSFFNTTIYQFSYGYSIFSKERYQAGVFIGAHIMNTQAGINIDGQTAGFISENSFGFTAPLPDLGIWGGYSISRRTAIRGDISYFALNLDNKSGRLLAFNLNLTYRMLKQLDVTLGYTGLDFKVDVVRKDVTGDFKWGYNGPVLTANYLFGRNRWKSPSDLY